MYMALGCGGQGVSSCKRDYCHCTSYCEDVRVWYVRVWYVILHCKSEFK